VTPSTIRKNASPSTAAGTAIGIGSTFARSAASSAPSTASHTAPIRSGRAICFSSAL
jgi:hypothetical protein